MRPGDDGSQTEMWGSPSRPSQPHPPIAVQLKKTTRDQDKDRLRTLRVGPCTTVTAARCNNISHGGSKIKRCKSKESSRIQFCAGNYITSKLLNSHDSHCRLELFPFAQQNSTAGLGQCIGALLGRQKPMFEHIMYAKKTYEKVGAILRLIQN